MSKKTLNFEDIIENYKSSKLKTVINYLFIFLLKVIVYISILTVLVFIISFLLFCIVNIYDAIDATIASLIASTGTAITIFVVTKWHERKLYEVRNSRESKIDDYQIYTEYLIKAYNKNNLDLNDLMTKNSKIMMKITDKTASKINKLIIAIEENKNSDIIYNRIFEIIKALRLELGYKEECFDFSINNVFFHKIED